MVDLTAAGIERLHIDAENARWKSGAAAAEARRAWADRRLKQLADERAAAKAPPAPTTSRKRGKRDRRPPLQRAMETRQEASRAAWAARHPHAAADERRLRKQRATLTEKWKKTADGTPETHEHASRRNQGALARLCEKGELARDQLAAAQQIREAHAAIGADVNIRTASLETRIDRTRAGDGTFYERLTLVRREVAYGEWRSACAARQTQIGLPVAALLEMIADGTGFTIVAKRYGVHNRKAKRALISALDLWPERIRAAYREISDAALAAAQARALA